MLLITIIVLFLVTISTNGALYEDCGLVSYPQMLIAKGNEAERGEVPWHAGVYSRLTTPPYKQICGGSLISSTIIISAAHCFWDEEDKLLPAANYAVGVGKLYRHWNNNLTKEVEEQQRSDVKEIHLPNHFQGNEANYQDDIAIVIVTRKFECTSSVRPVCVDFDIILERKHLQPGNKGKVAGWGLTSEDGKSSQALRVLELPYIDTTTCFIATPYTFHSHITGDKICAGYMNSGQAVCKGDSGGGLVFPELVNGQTRYYLRGVASAAPASASASMCNVDQYATFTRLLKHEHFIKDFWSANDNDTFCVFETRMQRKGCGWGQLWGNENNLTSNGEAQYGELPWMCAVIEALLETNKTTGEVNPRDVYRGSGVLIHPFVVLAGFYYLPTDKRYKVRAGVESGAREHPYQLRDVATVETKAGNPDGFSLMFLAAPMMPAPNVAVTCLPPPGQRVPSRTMCVATRWDHVWYAVYNYKAKLMKVEVSAMERDSCERELIQTAEHRQSNKLPLEYSCMKLDESKQATVTKKMCRDMDFYTSVFCPIKSEGEHYVLAGIVWGSSNCKNTPFWRQYLDISRIRAWIDERVIAKGYDPKEYTYGHNR